MGGASSSLLCSLTAFFVERTALPKIRQIHPSAHLSRYADDGLSLDLPLTLFELFLLPGYTLAGFEPVYDRPTGPRQSVTFLETEVCLLPLPHTRFYSKRLTLFSDEDLVPHRGGGREQKSYILAVYNLLRRVYNSESTLQGFAETIIMLANKHKQYPDRIFAQAAMYTLQHTHRNRYSLNPSSRRHLLLCLKEGVCSFTDEVFSSFIFL